MTVHVRRLFFCIAVALFAASLGGCAEQPPPRKANWFYYWRDGAVVGGLNNADWIWGSQAANVRGASSGSLSGIRLGVGTAAVGSRTTIFAFHVIDGRSQQIEAPRPPGIDGVAATVSHELEHLRIYDQWRTQTDTDGDDVPDTEEDATAGPPPAYDLRKAISDTYDMAMIWSDYTVYGDNEFLARRAGLAPQATAPLKDWSVNGKNWDH